MNLVDLAVLAVLAVSALAGLARGLVREVLSLAAWVGAGWVAFRYAPGALPAVREYVSDPNFAAAVAYGAVFLVALIVFSVVASVLSRTVRVSALGGLDRSLGVVFGLARGAVILAGAYVVGGFLQAPQFWPERVQQARSLPFVYAGAAWAAERLPPAERPHVAAPPQMPPPTLAGLLQQPPAGRAIGPAPGASGSPGPHE